MKVFIALLGLLFGFNLAAIEADCDGKNISVDKLDSLRAMLIAPNSKESMPSLNYPFKVQNYGALDSYSYELMQVIWDEVFSKEAKLKLSKATHCHLYEILGVVSQFGKYKATRLVFNFDKEDLKYSYSSISSAKSLKKFIEEVNTLANLDAKALSRYFLYPFVIKVNNNDLIISDEEDFNLNLKDIATPAFFRTLRGGLNEDNFRMHPIGIMLDSKGTIWVAETRHGKLVLMMNGSHVTP